MKGRWNTYSAEELAWVEAWRHLPRRLLHAAFVVRFERYEVREDAIKALCLRKGWKVGHAGRRAGRYRHFSRIEAAWLRENVTMETADWHKAFCAQFGRSDISKDQLIAFRDRRGWRTGRTGCFVKGQTPPNKGKKCPPGVGGNSPAARRTQFKKGQVSRNFKGAGHEWVDAKDGYVWLILAEKNPWTGAATRPVLKHRWLWEKKNGAIPKGHVLKCLDGNKQNCDPSNWELIPRAVNVWLNHKHNRLDYETAPAELRPAILAIAKLKVQQHVREAA